MTAVAPCSRHTGRIPRTFSRCRCDLGTSTELADSLASIDTSEPLRGGTSLENRHPRSSKSLRALSPSFSANGPVGYRPRLTLLFADHLVFDAGKRKRVVVRLRLKDEDALEAAQKAKQETETQGRSEKATEIPLDEGFAPRHPGNHTEPEETGPER